MNHRWVVVLAAAVIGLAVSPGAAGAQQDTTTTTSALSPEEEVPVDPTVPVPTLAPVTTLSDKPPEGDSLIPDAGVGDIPTSNFDIGYDEGAWNNFGRKALGFFTGVGWMANRVIAGITLWAVGWAFGFDIIGPLRGPVLAVAQVWNTNLAGPLRLGHLVWFLVVAYAAFQVWRGRAMHGMGEFLFSLAALAVATTVGGNPAGYMNGAVNTLRQTSGAVLAISRGQPPSDDPRLAAQIVDPLRNELHRVLVEEPHQIINWGRPLTGQCAAVARALASEGPWGASDEPRDLMNAAGCETEADFNHDPSFERMASAWMAAAVSLIVLGLLIVALVTMLIASLFFILRFSWIYLALIGLQLPGGAREFAWGWVVGLLKDLATVAGMSFVISYLMLLASAFLTAPGLGLAERFAVLVITALSMFLYRKRVLAAIAHLADRLRAELGSLRPGLGASGNTGWSMPSGATAGMSGYGLGTRTRAAVLDVPGTSAYELAYKGRRFRHPSSRGQRAYRQRFMAGADQYPVGQPSP